MSEATSPPAAAVRNPGRTDSATAEMDAWVLDAFGLDMNAWPPRANPASTTPAPVRALPAGAQAASETESAHHGTAGQIAVGVASGFYQGGKSLLGSLADLARLVMPFTEGGMILQLVDPHAPTARESLDTVAAGAHGAYSAASHPVATFDAARKAVQSFRKQFEAEQAEAEKNGTIAEFYSQFSGRAGFEIISALVPAGKLAEGLGLAAKAAKGAELVADADRAAEAAAKAESLLAKARQAEPALTRSIQGSAESQGGTMVGLEHRLKTPESLARKIASSAQERNMTAERAAERIRDAIRYTATFPPENLVAGAKTTLAKLQEEGNIILKLRNTWLNPQSSYKGVNVQLRSLDGQVFELQFHTPESFWAKDEGTHAIYEEMRKLPRGSPEWDVLNKKQMEIVNTLSIPKDIDHLKEVK